MRTITATVALTARHLPLVEAKNAVEAVMEGRPCPRLDLPMVEDASALTDELTGAGFVVTWLERPAGGQLLAVAARDPDLR